MLQLDAPQVAARLGRGPLIDALMRAFQGDYQVPDRQHYAVGGALNPKDILLVMPAWRVGGCLGVKLVTVFPGNGLRGESAVHATYALAARYLAPPDATRLLMVGTGGLAPHVIESHAAVRPISSVRVWGRRLEAAETVARGFADRPYEVEAVSDLPAAVRWADIISCATLAETPIVHGGWLRPGQHLDLIGSFTPAMREADDDALARAGIYVDTRAGALAESGELLHAIASGVIAATDVRGELADLARGTVAGRRSAEEITLFKSVGCAIEDLAAAELAIRASAPRRDPWD